MGHLGNGKNGATRYHILKLNAATMILAGAPPQTPLGELTVVPQTLLTGFKGLLLRGRGEEGRAW